MSDATPEPLTCEWLTPKRLKAFQAWVVAHGADVLAPTNEYETLRFSYKDSIGLIQHKKDGTIAYFNGPAHNALVAFRDGVSWRAKAKTERRSKRNQMIAALLHRDGPACLYCNRVLETDEDMSIEHIVALTSGGPDVLANMALCCQSCNSAVGHLSAVEKIRRVIDWRLSGRLPR